MAEYRIVSDSYAGYEVQYRRWYWPFWTQCGCVNTWCTLERAEKYANDRAKGSIKYLGNLPKQC